MVNLWLSNLFRFLVCPVKPEVLKRIQETFKRLSSNNSYLPQVTFCRDVLGDCVPAKLAEVIRSNSLCHCVHVIVAPEFLAVYEAVKLRVDPRNFGTQLTCNGLAEPV